MKYSCRSLLFAAISSISVPVLAATSNEDAQVEQIAHGIAASDKAVACHLRTSDWRKSVLLGYFAAARLGIMSKHPDASDDEINESAARIFKTAKIQAALHAQFASPTQDQCDTLNASHDMQEMDAAAKIGLMVGAVNDQ